MRIIVACPNWIGDAVMATPTLAALKAAQPESHLVLLARPYVAPVFQPAPYVDEFIPWNAPGAPGLLALVRRMRKLDYEVGILLANSFRSALLFFLGGVRRRLGYAREGRGLLLTDRFQPLKEHGHYLPMPMLTYYFDLARPLGARDGDLAMRLYTTPVDEAAADRLYADLGLDPARTLLMAPGAAFGLAKCWPADRFARVARAARDRLGLRTLLLGSPAEFQMAATVANASAGAAVLPPAPPKLATVKAVVRRARALVANDSGLRHFGAAYDIPVVAIFGPTHINWTETWFPKEAKLQASIPCGPCQKKVCPEGHLQCMAAITPDQVFDALSKLLKEHPYQVPREDTVIRA